MLTLLSSMEPMVMLVLDMLVLVMLDMLAILMPMVLTPMPMVLTTLERGRLRLSPRLMLMLLFSTVPTWDKKLFLFPPVLLNSITIAYQTIYLRKRSKQVQMIVIQIFLTTSDQLSSATL